MGLNLFVTPDAFSVVAPELGLDQDQMQEAHYLQVAMWTAVR